MCPGQPEEFVEEVLKDECLSFFQDMTNHHAHQTLTLMIVGLETYLSGRAKKDLKKVRFPKLR